MDVISVISHPSNNQSTVQPITTQHAAGQFGMFRQRSNGPIRRSRSRNADTELSLLPPVFGRSDDFEDFPDLRESQGKNEMRNENDENISIHDVPEKPNREKAIFLRDLDDTDIDSLCEILDRDLSETSESASNDGAFLPTSRFAEASRECDVSLLKEIVARGEDVEEMSNLTFVGCHGSTNELLEELSSHPSSKNERTDISKVMQQLSLENNSNRDVDSLCAILDGETEEPSLQSSTGKNYRESPTVNIIHLHHTPPSKAAGPDPDPIDSQSTAKRRYISEVERLFKEYKPTLRVSKLTRGLRWHRQRKNKSTRIDREICKDREADNLGNTICETPFGKVLKEESDLADHVTAKRVVYDVNE